MDGVVWQKQQGGPAVLRNLNEALSKQYTYK